MTPRMQYTDKELLWQTETHAKGFDGWKKGVYDIWVRRDDQPSEMDEFNDKVYTFSCAADGSIPEFRMVCTGTSHAGSYGLKQFQKYNRLGCAVLEADRIVYESHLFGRHKNYPAYRQAKGFPYYRDNDRDNLAEEVGKVYNDIIFANCHRASQTGESTRIYNWSVACLVRNKSNQWNAWLAYMDKRPLSVVILKEF